jgi:threonine dehydrogenase-like Zn-dependent dehydrogenase
VDAPFTIAFECSGRASAASAALDQLDYAGTLVLVGTGHELPRINHNRMIILELTIIGAFNYDADGFSHALHLLASGSMPIDLLVEPEDVTLGGLSAAMDALAKGEIAGKVLVRPEVSP